jgi:hypothetical protein
VRTGLKSNLEAYVDVDAYLNLAAEPETPAVAFLTSLVRDAGAESRGRKLDWLLQRRLISRNTRFTRDGVGRADVSEFDGYLRVDGALCAPYTERSTRYQAAIMEAELDGGRADCLNGTLLKKINATLVGAPGPTHKYREGENWIGSEWSPEKAVAVPPDAAKVPALMEQLSRLHTPGRLGGAVAAYGYFLQVHPFNDGNGRCSRLLLSAELTRSLDAAFPILLDEEFLLAERDVNVGLRTAGQSESLRSFSKALMDVIARSCLTIRRLEYITLRDWEIGMRCRPRNVETEVWERILSLVLCNEHTASEWISKIIGVSMEVAKHAISVLVQHGIVDLGYRSFQIEDVADMGGLQKAMVVA